MYCSSCGMSVAPSLSYCNRCGAELNPKDRRPATRSEASQESLVWALVSVTVVGIGAVIGLMAVMREVVHLNIRLIIAFPAFAFPALLAVDSVIIWLLFRPSREAPASYMRTQPSGL